MNHAEQGAPGRATLARALLLSLPLVLAFSLLGVPSSSALPGGGLKAARPYASTHSAGQNARAFNDGLTRWEYMCVGDQARFKVTKASIVMWARGARINGFHFKYRLVAAGTDGQPQWWSNWSGNVTHSFKTNAKVTRWMTAPALGQSFGTTTDWDMEVKLKYPRSLRKAYRYKWRFPIAEPQCGVLG